MLETLFIIACVIMAILSITGIWEANKFGVAMLWIIIAFLFYGLTELTTAYKAVVIMLNS